jgi:hypothetical protein
MNTLKIGNIIYSRKFKFGVTKDDPEAHVNGHLVCLILGQVSPGNDKCPDEREIWQLMGGAGLCSFDIIREALGDDEMKKVLEYFVDKFKDEKVQIIQP